MKTVQFKTNINCGGCIAKATPTLNEVVGAGQWTVDTQNPNTVLTISNDNVNEIQLKQALD